MAKYEYKYFSVIISLKKGFKKVQEMEDDNQELFSILSHPLVFVVLGGGGGTIGYTFIMRRKIPIANGKIIE